MCIRNICNSVKDSNCYAESGKWCSDPDFPKTERGRWMCANCPECRSVGGTALGPETTQKSTTTTIKCSNISINKLTLINNDLYKNENKWITQNLSITMRTPGDDENLVSGLIFSERIIQNKSSIESIEVNGKNKSKYEVDNSLVVTLAKGNQLDLKFSSSGDSDSSYNLSFESKASKHKNMSGTFPHRL